MPSTQDTLRDRSPGALNGPPRYRPRTHEDRERIIAAREHYLAQRGPAARRRRAQYRERRRLEQRATLARLLAAYPSLNDGSDT